MDNKAKYWHWFFKGFDGKKPGWKTIFDWYILVHFLIAIGLAHFVDLSSKDAAEKALFPLSGIFIGLSFAWVGNAQALLQTQEIAKLSDHLDGGLARFVYTFQTSILIILVTLSFWGLTALGVFEFSCLESKDTKNALSYFFEIILYFLASLTVRECWQVIMFSQAILLARHILNKTK